MLSIRDTFFPPPPSPTEVLVDLQSRSLSCRTMQTLGSKLLLFNWLYIFNSHSWIQLPGHVLPKQWTANVSLFSLAVSHLVVWRSREQKRKKKKGKKEGKTKFVEFIISRGDHKGIFTRKLFRAYSASYHGCFRIRNAFQKKCAPYSVQRKLNRDDSKFRSRFSIPTREHGFISKRETCVHTRLHRCRSFGIVIANSDMLTIKYARQHSVPNATTYRWCEEFPPPSWRKWQFSRDSNRFRRVLLQRQNSNNGRRVRCSLCTINRCVIAADTKANRETFTVGRRRNWSEKVVQSYRKIFYHWSLWLLVQCFL